MALHVRHGTPCDVILMAEWACLQLKDVVAYCSLVYFRFSYALFCFACFVVVPCVLHMRPYKRYCDLQPQSLLLSNNRGSGTNQRYVYEIKCTIIPWIFRYRIQVANTNIIRYAILNLMIITCLREWIFLVRIECQQHNHLARFDVVTPPLSCSFSYLYLGPSCLIYAWMRRQAENPTGTSYISTKWLWSTTRTHSILAASTMTYTYKQVFRLWRLIVRSREVSKPRDLYLELSDWSAIWRARRQPICLSNCKAMWWFKLSISRLRDF